MQNQVCECVEPELEFDEMLASAVARQYKKI
jgi:hypothetical protein